MAAPPAEHGKSMAAEEAEVTSELQVKPERGRTTTPRPPEIDAAFPPARQSSIYSRTLDEIQNTVCEPGKNFGSMNMDEFLTNLWNAEEGFVATGAVAAPVHPAAGPVPLNRQGSLSIPSPLCRKTVDEVWAEIHCEQQQGRRLRLQQPSQERQPTFGEMTLEDFLIKAGVVREGYSLAAPSPLQPAAAPPPQYDLALGFEHVYGGVAVPNGRRGDPYCFTGEDGGGAVLQLGMALSPASPISSDGIDGSGGVPVYVGGKNGSGGRKRIPDGAAEVVVERRQRRMIKNRESAARSRARKQAYTVELEAELNQLKEENFRLREEERRARQTRKQMLLEAMAEQARYKLEKASIRRCNSSPS